MQIRHANHEDNSFLARTILLAGRAHVRRGIWEVILGGTEEESLAFLNNMVITRVPHLFHHSHYLIAEDDSAGPVGSLGGYDPGTSGYQALQQAIPEVVEKLKLSAQQFKASEERSARILKCLPRVVDGAWVIDSVATLPGHRKKGVAEGLLSAILEKGGKKGYPQAQVNMYIGNEPALNLYQKFGFRIIEETRDTYFEKHIGSSGMLSLARKL